MRKLLIAINSEIITERLRSALPQYEIHTCSNGFQALDSLNALRPNVLIIDLCLLGLDGLTVLKETEFLPSAVLALTTLASQPVLDAAAEAGAQDVVLLPCSCEHLIKHLDALIEKVPSAD